jgi:Na+/phosphate symporter
MKIACRQNRPSVIVVLAVLLTLLLPLIAYATKDENPELTQLLADANDEAFELARDATNTQMLIRTDENWVDHALMLAKVKGHVDNLALIIEKLNKAQKSGSELQEQAVEQMLPLVKQLSANTTAAINYLKQSKTRPISDTYTRYLEKNAETAHQLSSIISSLIDYEKSMTEIERLRSKLEAPGN